MMLIHVDRVREGGREGGREEGREGVRDVVGRKEGYYSLSSPSLPLSPPPSSLPPFLPLQERALDYLTTCIDQVNEFNDILQLVIVELVYKVRGQYTMNCMYTALV